MDALPLHTLKMKPVALDSLLSVHELFEKAMSFALVYVGLAAVLDEDRVTAPVKSIASVMVGIVRHCYDWCRVLMARPLRPK